MSHFIFQYFIDLKKKINIVLISQFVHKLNCSKLCLLLNIIMFKAKYKSDRLTTIEVLFNNHTISNLKLLLVFIGMYFDCDFFFFGLVK